MACSNMHPIHVHTCASLNRRVLAGDGVCAWHAHAWAGWMHVRMCMHGALAGDWVVTPADLEPLEPCHACIHTCISHVYGMCMVHVCAQVVTPADLEPLEYRGVAPADPADEATYDTATTVDDDDDDDDE